MLVVIKSLCGFVSKQVQYNMKSAQYLGHINYIIIIIIIHNRKLPGGHDRQVLP